MVVYKFGSVVFFGVSPETIHKCLRLLGPHTKEPVKLSERASAEGKELATSKDLAVPNNKFIIEGLSLLQSLPPTTANNKLKQGVELEDCQGSTVKT